MTEADVYEKLTDVFRDVFMRDDMTLQPAMTAKDVDGWDSLKQIEIIIASEGSFGIKFHTRDLDSLQTVGDLARVIMVKTA